MKILTHIDLENILQKYFNCKKPFLDNPYYDEDERAPVTFTEDGARAYGELINLLYAIGTITNNCVNGLIDKLDEIASEI